MKKLMALLLVGTIVLASCGKERKLNRKLDGKWTLVTVDGVSLPSGYSMTIEFDKDKKGGTYIMTDTDPSGSESTPGTYTLTKDELITMTDEWGTDIATVTDYSKTDLTLTSYGDVIVFKKD